MLGDVRDGRAAQAGADVVPPQAPTGRVPVVSQRSPPRSVRSTPPTKATSSSTTTSFSWWQCRRRSRASTCTRTPVPRLSSAQTARTAARLGVKALAARRPRGGRGRRPRGGRRRRAARAARSGGSSRSSAKCGDTAIPPAGRCAARPGWPRRSPAGPRRRRRAPPASTRRAAAAPRAPRAAVVGRAQRLRPPEAPQAPRVVEGHRALDRAPQPTVERAEGIHGRSIAAAAPARQSGGPGAARRDRRRDPTALAQPVRACNACVHASKRCTAHVSPAELAEELLASGTTS